MVTHRSQAQKALNVQVTPIWAQRQESAHTWVFGRNEMRIAQDIIPKSGMACIHDLAIKGNVHPSDKIECIGRCT